MDNSVMMNGKEEPLELEVEVLFERRSDKPSAEGLEKSVISVI